MPAHKFTAYAVKSKNHTNQEQKVLGTYPTKRAANNALRKIAKQLNPQGAAPWLSTYNDSGFTVSIAMGRLVWYYSNVGYVVDRV